MKTNIKLSLGALITAVLLSGCSNGKVSENKDD